MGEYYGNWSKLNNQASNSFYNDRIDYLKAISAFLVVLGHSILFYLGEQKQSICIRLIYIIITSVHVPVFFITAGYLSRKQKLKNYYAKKLKRLLVPYFTFATLKLLYSNIISNEFAHGESLKMQIFDAVFIGSLYWFVYAILIMYFIAPFIWKKKGISDRTYFIRYLVVCLIVFWANLMIADRKSNQMESLFQFYNVLYYLPFFLVGYVIGQYKEKFSLRFEKGKKTISLLSFLIATVISVFKVIKIDINYIIQFIYSLSLAILIYFFVCCIPRNIKFLRVISYYSLQIMFFDSFFKVILFRAFSQIIDINIWMALLISVINIGCTCMVCTVLERIPGICFMFGLKLKKS